MVAESKQVSVDGVEWSYVSTGSEAKPVVLFVHGFPLDHTMWSHQLSDSSGLASQARLIAPDLPGFGKSRSSSNAPSIADIADGLAHFLDAISVDRVVFCGLSMGGYIGWQFWRRHPDRVLALVGCDTRSAADAPEVARGRELMAARVRNEGSADVSGLMIPKLFAASAVESGSPAVAEMTSVIDRTDAESIARGQLAMAARVDATEWLSEIEVPMLLVVGSEDVITTSAEMRSMSEAGNAEFAEIDGAGHMAPLEKPDEFNAILSAFLSRVRS